MFLLATPGQHSSRLVGMLACLRFQGHIQGYQLYGTVDDGLGSLYKGSASYSLQGFRCRVPLASRSFLRPAVIFSCVPHPTTCMAVCHVRGCHHAPPPLLPAGCRVHQPLAQHHPAAGPGGSDGRRAIWDATFRCRHGEAQQVQGEHAGAVCGGALGTCRVSMQLLCGGRWAHAG